MAKQQQQNKRRRSMRGGNCEGAGGAAHAQAVYGNAASQHAASGTNVIAMNPVVGGGKRSKKGGVGFVDAIVPGFLMAANHFYKRGKPAFSRKTSKRAGRRARLTRRR
jgi:hypothetical protein